MPPSAAETEGAPVRRLPLLPEPLPPLPIARKASLAAEILRAYVQVRWRLRRRQLSGTVETLHDWETGSKPPEDPTNLATGLRLGRAVGRVLSPLPGDTRCLVRSLVLTALLRRRGIGSSLVIGVRPDPDFAAHAWVEYERTPLLRDEEHVYRRLVEFGEDGAEPRRAR
jgi:hypothetical protein